MYIYIYVYTLFFIGYLLLHTCYVRHIASVMSGSLQRLQLQLRLGAVWSERSRRIARNPWSLGRKNWNWTNWDILEHTYIHTYMYIYIHINIYIYIDIYIDIYIIIYIDIDIPCTLGYKYIYILGSTLVFFGWTGLVMWWWCDGPRLWWGGFMLSKSTEMSCYSQMILNQANMYIYIYSWALSTIINYHQNYCNYHELSSTISYHCQDRSDLPKNLFAAPASHEDRVPRVPRSLEEELAAARFEAMQAVRARHKTAASQGVFRAAGSWGSKKVMDGDGIFGLWNSHDFGFMRLLWCTIIIATGWWLGTMEWIWVDQVGWSSSKCDVLLVWFSRNDGPKGPKGPGYLIHWESR
jgi:hypothetical protein